MRKTIRRSMFLTATAGLALLGFGLGQASAAVPALPALPATPVVPALLGKLTTIPALPDSSSWLTGFDDLTGDRSAMPTPQLPALGSLPGVMDLLPDHNLLGNLSDATDLPNLGRDALPVADLPTDQLGLPVNVDSSKLPQLPQLPVQTSDITKAPIAELPNPSKMPLTAQVDYNDIANKIIPNTDGVDMQGLPKPQVPEVASTLNAVQLPTSTPLTPGMQSVGVPSKLPLVGDVDTTMPSVDDLTGGGLSMPKGTPQLPAV
ncbi:hypothetical protein [Actinocrispum wychmicini]|uniref:GLTT repeat-containing protein n=1 Tax=Actinocrispum wychmicini TaxID=1213861 RepID=A0A4R2JXU8_9PSEU|nr:hypothetical protein [Actinocrispum wychmicini]TCO64704.1 hypothetical protein EV192_101486 [Actinocrispum wychmicini]